MKIKWVLILGLLLTSCSNQLIRENTLYITRKYCGDLDTVVIEKKYLKIITTQDYFYIPRIELNIPKGSKCYVKYIPDYLSGNIASKVWVLYFTWEGTEDYYMIRQNFITGQIIR